MTPEQLAASEAAQREADIARLLRNIVEDPHPDAPRFLLEHLAYWGPAGLDVRDLAGRALDLAGDE